jgi:hypothetical protein
MREKTENAIPSATGSMMVSSVAAQESLTITHKIVSGSPPTVPFASVCVMATISQ